MPGVDGAETPERETEAAVRIQAESHVAAGREKIRIFWTISGGKMGKVRSMVESRRNKSWPGHQAIWERDAKSSGK